jgi:hypothetical protein
MSELNKAEPSPLLDPSALSNEYHRAHKQLLLWSAILFSWELVGIDLDKAKESGGNVGGVISAIKSPQAIPWALIVLIGYFLFKCSIEWAQCTIDRRKVRFARFDFLSGWLISLSAIMLYIGQAVSHIQFADAIQDYRFPGIMFAGGLFGGGIGSFTAIVLWKRRSLPSPPQKIFLWPGLMFGWGTLTSISNIYRGIIIWRVWIAAFVIAVILGWLIMAMVLAALATRSRSSGKQGP